MCSYYLLATSGNDHTLIQWILKCSRDDKKNRFQAEINVSFIVKEAHASAITCVRYNMNLLYSKVNRIIDYVYLCLKATSVIKHLFSFK